jgi:hypothetical protein
MQVFLGDFGEDGAQGKWNCKSEVFCPLKVYAGIGTFWPLFWIILLILMFYVFKVNKSANTL